MGQIFNISSSLPFLDSLAAGIVERFGDLENITIYLPNRRSVKPLAESFFRVSGRKSLILPKIMVIGDVDEEELEVRYFPDYEDIPPAISATERLYRIAGLIYGKRGAGQKIPDFAQCIALAKSLIMLIDELQDKKLGFEVLANVVPEDFAEHWQLTLDFLKVISEDWQNYLQENNLLEPIIRRNLLLEKLSEFYRRSPPEYPVIIAGTTGSILATSEFIEAVIAADNGYLVLDGLDRNLRDEDFKIIEETHPQYNLGSLLERLKIEANAVTEWEERELTARQELISTAMFPTARTPEWKEYKCAEQHDLHLIEAANVEEEAMAIAVALREVLEHESRTAMVVSSNRALTERVAAKMRIWDVEINNSAGQNYLELPASHFLLELAEMLRSRQAPVPLLSFFKHPFVPLEMKNQIREIEIEFLRGPRVEDFDIAEHGIKIADLKKLEKMFSYDSVSLKTMLELHIMVAESIAGREVLWGKEGFEVYEYLQEFKKSIDVNHKIDPQLYPEILAQFISTKTYRPKFGAHPRINIYEPQEARLQNADMVIIAGMNEGSFPALPLQDSFMNLEIRKKIGLDSPAQSIGKAAHDFELLSQAPCVIYTRSQKEGGSPAIKSRFLQRLETICKLGDGGKYCDWAKNYHTPSQIKAAKRPQPVPPLEARPRELSATRVGNLMRDPYVVYAEKILRLKKLDAIDEEVTANKFGNFMHDALEEYAKNFDGKLETLLEIGRQKFRQFENKLGAKTFWWPKFLRIAKWFVENETGARENGGKFYFEESGDIKIGGMVFTAKADRVETNAGVKIIDYKTGAPPSFDKVEKGLDPQLAIEAIIFGEKFSMPVEALEYWYLSGRDEAVIIKAYKGAVGEIVDSTRKGLENLAATFLNEETPFIARPWSAHALKYNDYEHLARIKEWDE